MPYDDPRNTELREQHPVGSNAGQHTAQRTLHMSMSSHVHALCHGLRPVPF